ncbi:MAG: IclR family transcriptional regulator [Pseudomonadota bacterium]
MSTVDKALSVLKLFSESQPNLGLSEIARQLGWDKSNVQRYVADLARHGILEQSPKDKSYFLGPSLTRLSMMRDLTHPVADEVHRALKDLTHATGETAHANIRVGDRLTIMGIVETKIRGTRVYVDPAEDQPFHATAAGLAFLSHSQDLTVQQLLSGKLRRHTPHTIIDRGKLQEKIQTVRKVGYAKASGTYEADVVGIAAPILGFQGDAVGDVGVATPSARFVDGSEKKISEQVKKTAWRLSKAYGAP